VALRIEVHEGEDWWHVLWRFRRLVLLNSRKPYYKRAAGFYCKPGELASHRRYVERLRHRTGDYSLRLCGPHHDRHPDKHRFSHRGRRREAQARYKRRRGELEERLAEWEAEGEPARRGGRVRGRRKPWLEDE
jgi:hypothetical protein